VSRGSKGDCSENTTLIRLTTACRTNDRMLRPPRPLEMALVCGTREAKGQP
jgi:hypothetical protein